MSDTSIGGRLWGALASLKLPSLGQDVPIPVYVVHNSDDAEDYFFIFDFELFAERSRAGLFPRPRLAVSAGRSDFSRTTFARQFRETFSAEFDRMRADQNQGGGEGALGWFSWDFGLSPEALGRFMGQFVLYLALSTGKGFLSAFGVTRLWPGKSAEARIEDDIADLQSRVDTALGAIDVRLHEDLFEHARALGGPARKRDMDYAAWPLPGNVRAHLEDGTSSAWW